MRGFKKRFSKKTKSNPPSLEDHSRYESIKGDPDPEKTPCALTDQKDDDFVSNKVESAVIRKVKTLYQFTAEYDNELQFEKGEILDIIEKPANEPGWLTARNRNGNVGYIPSEYVRGGLAACHTADNPYRRFDEYGKINERHLDEISSFLARNWKELGRKLRVEEATIEVIDEDNEEVREKTYQLLLGWKRTNGRDANAEVLANALVLTGRRDVAEILASIMAEPSYAEPPKSYVLFGTPKPDAENTEGYATPYGGANIAGGRDHKIMENAGYARPYEEPNIAAATSFVRNTVPRQTVGPQTQLTGKRQNPRAANAAVKSGEKAEPSYAEPPKSYVLFGTRKPEGQNTEGYALPYGEPNIAVPTSCVRNTGGALQRSSECVKHRAKLSEFSSTTIQALSCLLNTKQELEGDFRSMGKELGYSEGEIKQFGESFNPTKSILMTCNDLFAVEV